MARNRDEARGERIQGLRKPTGWKQKEAARIVGVSWRSYQNWEAGGGIAEEHLHPLARALHTTVEYILYGDPTDATPPDPVAVARRRSEILNLNDRLDEITRAVGALQEGLGEVGAALNMLRVEAAELRLPPSGDARAEGPEPS